MVQPLDGRNKLLQVGDWVAIAPCGTAYAWTRVDCAEISNIEYLPPPVASLKEATIVLSFKDRKLRREAYQVLKLEQ